MVKKTDNEPALTLSAKGLIKRFPLGERSKSKFFTASISIYVKGKS